MDAAKNAVNAVKGWLGIKSPSRLMRDEVGKYMALGMGIGFEKNVPTEDMSKEIEASVLKLQLYRYGGRLWAPEENIQRGS